MPITMMFAADQIAVSYREYVSDYRILVKGQIVTAEKFDIDYVSCISDPAREAFDYGASVLFYENQPPAIDELNALLSDKSKLRKLQVPSPEDGTRMADRLNAAALFREKIGGEKIIEGWVEGPCAEAADLRGINALMMDFYDDPSFVKDLFEFVVEKAIQFARAQIKAGVDLIGIGDAAASLVGPAIYHEFVFPFEQKLIEGIKNAGGKVRLHICGDTRKYLSDLGLLGCEIVDLDFMVSLRDARAAMGPGQMLLGNLNPVTIVLEGTESDVLRELEQCCKAAGPRYIVGAGCEIPRGTPEINLHAMRGFCDKVNLNY
jgi:MtaA/CmuA family methyltransferase